MTVKTVTKSLCDRLNEGKITLREAAVELHSAGHFNYVPSEKQVKDYLNKCEQYDMDLEVITIRDLFWNNIQSYFAAEKTNCDYLVHYSPTLRRAIKDIEIFKKGDQMECRKYNDDGETYQVICYSEIPDTTLAIWNQFIQKKMYATGATYERVYPVSRK